MVLTCAYFMCVLWVAVAEIKYVYMYVMSIFRFISRETLDLTALYFKLYMILDNHNGQVLEQLFAASAMLIAN